MLCLDVGRQKLSSGTRGSGSDVDDIGTLGEEPAGMEEHGVGAVVAAAVVEGVGSDVEYAHDGRAAEGDEASADSDGEWSEAHLHNT